MDIKPLMNYVLIKKDEEKTVSSGGIFIPETSQEKPSTGTVLDIGEGLWDDAHGLLKPMTVKVGDKVLFPRLGGKTVEFDGEEFLLIRETELLAIIK